MSTINAIAVDDEPLALGLMKKYISQTPFLTLAGTFGNGQEALDKINGGDVDLAFVDIQMPGMSGLTLAGNLQAMENPPKTIFTTAYAQHALEGYKLAVVDYLLKPFGYEDFLRGAKKAEHIINLERQNREKEAADTGQQNAEDFFFVKSEYRLVRIDTPDIIYIEGLKDYIKIYLEGVQKPVLTLQSLKEMQNRLPADRFARTHRSFIVNLDKIKGLGKGVVLTTRSNIPIGDGYRAEFLNKIQNRTI